MNTNLPINTNATCEATTLSPASRDVASILELLETAGLAAEGVFDGPAERCPHCASRVLWEAA